MLLTQQDRLAVVNLKYYRKIMHIYLGVGRDGAPLELPLCCLLRQKR